MKKHRVTVFLIGICILLSGCRSGVFGSDYAMNTAEYSFELPAEEVKVSYEVPEALPNVFTDRFGYEPESSKIVIFRGTQLPAFFTVRDAETGKTVYTGTVKTKGNDKTEKEYNCYGDFSDFRRSGNYYIQIDVYGESYPFLIHDNLYYSLFNRAYSRLHAMRGSGAGEENEGWQMKEKGESREMNACLSIYQLLLSYEMFPSVYTDDMGIDESGNDIADILDECRYEIEWLIRQSQINPGGSGVPCGYRAAVLAKYAYLTKNMDAAFSGECLRAAEFAWKSALEDQSVPKELLSLAASELYRLTGSRQYLATAEEYLKKCSKQTGRLTALEFFSGVTYLNTKNKIDMELCDALIKKIMEEAEEIAEQSKKNSFLIYSGKERADRGVLLEEMIRICVVNHVITNHEYNTVIENHFHYLMGRNPDSICHVSFWEGQELQTADILDDPVQNTAFIFVLSELLGNT